VAFFVIAVNSNDKLLSRGNKNEYHYNAHCFTALIKEDLSFYNFHWVEVSDISNFYSLNKTSFRIREMYFKELSSREDIHGKSLYKYNLDDTRFWTGPLW
jgi:hypothetical protein